MLRKRTTFAFCLRDCWVLGVKARYSSDLFSLKFVLYFLKGVVSTYQPGQINGFDRCFQVVNQCTARRHRVTPVLAKTQILKFYSPIWGNKSSSRELLSPIWGLLTSFDGTLKHVLGLPNAKFDSITQYELDNKLLSIPEVCITSNNKTKIVLNIEKQPQ